MHGYQLPVCLAGEAPGGGGDLDVGIALGVSVGANVVVGVMLGVIVRVALGVIIAL